MNDNHHQHHQHHHQHTAPAHSGLSSPMITTLTLEEIELSLSNLHTQIDRFLHDKAICDDNIQRRKYYSSVELLRIEVEQLAENELNGSEVEKEKQTVSETETVTKRNNRVDVVTAKMNDLIHRLKLVPVKRKTTWFTHIEISLRFLGVCGAFVFFGTFVSLPILLIRVIDLAFNSNPFNYLSEQLKHVVLSTFLFLSGIEVEVQGLRREFFDSPCALLTFTHASNLDGFLVAGTCPIRQLAFGKKELFVVPFFSWLSLAIGGVPVDRGNRDRAVQALQRSVESAKKSKVAIAIAPEGTRSTTGQLLPFKKGTFYMWEELKSPIVPMIIFGAYDLYPVGSWVNRTGIVTVRYLPPLHADVGLSRDDMLKKLRRQMLNSLADCPTTVGSDISPLYWLLGMIGNALSVVLNISIGYYCYQLFVVEKQMSAFSIAAWFGGITIFITAMLYIYYVYLVDMGSKPSKKK